MPTGSKLEEIMNELDRLTQAAGSVEDYMWEIVKLLHDRMLKYNWVGFYMLDRSSSSQAPMLVLGPFQGAMTVHTRIPLNMGICGAAASTGKTVVADDVKLEPVDLNGVAGEWSIAPGSDASPVLMFFMAAAIAPVQL